MTKTSMSPVIKKELLGAFRTDHTSKSKSILSMIATGILNVVIIFFVVWLFSLIDANVTNLENGGEMVLTLALSTIIIIYTFIHTNSVSKVLFNSEDKTNIRVMPVSKPSIVIPKLVACFLKILATYSVIFLALLITYGVRHTDIIQSWYWVLAIVFTISTSFIILFFSVLLAYPYNLLKAFINRHSIAQFFASIILVALLSCAYFFIVSLFIDLVASENISIIFSPKNIEIASNICKYLIPTNYMVQVLNNHDKWLHLLIYIGVFVVAITAVYYVALFYYNRYLKLDEKFTVVKVSNKRIQKFPLLTKDLKLMFRNTGGTFNFFIIATVGSLFAAFLAFLTGRLYEIYGLNLIPETQNGPAGVLLIIKFLYFPLIVFFVTLFISLTFSSETSLFSRESKTASVILTMPQTFKRQVTSKIIVNLSMLFLVNLLSFILIASLKILPIAQAAILFLISLFITFSTFLFSASHSLAVNKPLTQDSNIAHISAFNFLYSISIPVVTFLLILLLLVITYYANGLTTLKPEYSYLIVGGLAIIMFIIAIFLFKRRLKKFSKFLSTGGTK